MKKISLLLSLPVVIALVSFSKPMLHSSKSTSTDLIPAVRTGVKTCPAPYNLSATLHINTGGTYVDLSWTSGQGSSWSYSGYYFAGGTRTPFGGSTSVWPVGVPCPSNISSITFSVTIHCLDGSTATSAPFSRTFP